MSYPSYNSNLTISVSWGPSFTSTWSNTLVVGLLLAFYFLDIIDLGYFATVGAVLAEDINF